MSETGLSKVLSEKAAQIASGAALLSQHTSDWQVIRDYLTNRSAQLKLTPKQQDKLQRYQFVYNMLAAGKYLEREVVVMLTKSFPEIQERQAYQDLRDAKELYPVLFNINKAFELRLMLDRNLVMLQKAEAAGDLRSYAALEKNRNKMLEMVREEETSLLDVFQPHTYVLMFDPTLIGAQPVDMKAVHEYINRRRKGGNTQGVQEAEVVNG